MLSPATKRRAANDHLVRAPRHNLCGTSYGANPTAHANLHTLLFCTQAKLPHEAAVAASPHSCIQINYVEQRIPTKAIEQPVHIADRELSLASSDQLHRQAALQINTRNNHRLRLTATPCSARKSFSSPRRCTSS